jgi:hypothetical protein
MPTYHGRGRLGFPYKYHVEKVREQVENAAPKVLGLRCRALGHEERNPIVPRP